MNFNQPKTGRRAALREGREGVEEPWRGKQRLLCWLRYWLNFTRLYHYQVSYKMKNFRLLYQQTTPVTLFPICFCLFVFVVVVFFLSRENFEKLMREGGNSIETRTNHLPWLEDRTHSYKWRGERLSVPQSHWVNSLQRNAAEAWKKYFLTWLNREYISLLASCYQIFSRVIKIKWLGTFLLLVMITNDFWWEFFESSRLN